jgi:hypothetical protein
MIRRGLPIVAALMLLVAPLTDTSPAAGSNSRQDVPVTAPAAQAVQLATTTTITVSLTSLAQGITTMTLVATGTVSGLSASDHPYCELVVAAHGSVPNIFTDNQPNVAVGGVCAFTLNGSGVPTGIRGDWGFGTNGFYSTFGAGSYDVGVKVWQTGTAPLGTPVTSNVMTAAVS